MPRKKSGLKQVAITFRIHPTIHRYLEELGATMPVPMEVNDLVRDLFHRGYTKFKMDGQLSEPVPHPTPPEEDAPPLQPGPEQRSTEKAGKSGRSERKQSGGRA